ncbi:RHS repeat domain-containing protein [Stenotrophomonas maltophilia]|uniref:RHS repeat domain-containing protein n=1 Tax=Stenotrophomonas maltophilia TaxID=40324 RepID=UPI0002D8CC2A|nr:RHS repeat-associated core domain-containing protein [Stenotrophomonas maltophilia]
MNAGMIRAHAAALLGIILASMCQIAYAQQASIELIGPAQSSYTAPATYQFQMKGKNGTGTKAEYLTDVALTRNGVVVSRLLNGTYTESGISAGTYQYVMTATAVRNFNGDETYRELRSTVYVINVAAPPIPFDGAEYVSWNGPASADRGTSFSGTVTFRNSGNTIWRAAEGYRLGQAQGGYSTASLGIGELPVPNDTPPGATVTFTYNGVAPNENGLHDIQWQMNRNGSRFGSTSAAGVFEVTGRLNRGVVYEQEVPATMEAGRAYTIKMKFVNTGNTTWRASTGYALGSWNPENNTRWGVARVQLPNDVIPQLPAFFEFTVTAPSLPGTYSFQWRMLEEGVEWFGGASPEVQVTVNGPPSKVVGNIDSVNASGQITGWACSTRIDAPIDVHVYTGGAAGGGGTFLAGARADQASEPSVQSACLASGSHRFSIQLSNADRRQRAGQAVYVHGISPVGQPNNAIGGSGVFVVPPAPSGTLSASPQSCQIATGAQTCNVGLTWTSNDPRAELRNAAGAAIASGSGGNLGVSIGAGVNRFTLVVGSDLLAQTDVTAKAPPLPPGTPDNPAPTVTRRYVYDDNLRLCKSIEPETGATVLEYDAAGNVAWSAQGLDLPDPTRCDRDVAHSSARRVVYAYDALNRNIQTTYPDGLGNLQVEYTADGKMKSETAFNQDGVTVVTGMSYNSLGLMVGHSRIIGTANPRTSTFGYNSLGQQVKTRYPDGYEVHQTMNALGQPIKLQDGQGGLLAYDVSYAPSGMVSGMTYGNGIVRRVHENARQLMSTVQDGSVLNLIYDYDATGNVVSILDGVRGDVGKVSLGYDRLERLILANSPSFGGNGNYTFSYDTLDNIVSMRLQGKRERTFNYDARNRLQLLRDQNGSGVFAFAYDDAGNMTTRNGEIFDFDVGGRLRAGGVVSKYLYDGSGNRAAAEGGVYRTWNYVADGRLIESTRGAEVSDYLYLGDELLSIRTDTGNGAKLSFLHKDARMTLIATSDASGSVLSRHVWSPYGEPDAPPDAEIPGYAGHLSDADTSLVYMGQRYYDPAIGIFISPDPITPHENPLGAFNRYRYANSNPYRFTDPDGRLSRGTGWDDRQWNKFDRAQQQAAGKLEAASSKISGALAAGGRALERAGRAFERNFGAGTGTPENMAKVASDMSSMASALRDTGAGAIPANAMTGAAMASAYPGVGGDTLAGVPTTGPKQVIVNISHPGFSSRSTLSWGAGHETAHAVLGYRDQRMNGIPAYKFGSSEQRDVFRSLPGAQRLINPDHLMDQAR